MAIGACVALGLLALVVLGLGALWLTRNDKTSDELRAGQCIDSPPLYSDLSVKVVSCSSNKATFRVVSNDKATGDYPGTLDALAAECREQGDEPTLPDEDSWNHGHHRVLCLTGTGRVP